MATNPYMNTVNPYMVGEAQGAVMAPNQSPLMQTMQNQQLMRSQEQLLSDAGNMQVKGPMGGGSSPSGQDPNMMAQALRNYGNMANVASGNKYDTGFGSEQSRMLAMQEKGLYGY